MANETIGFSIKVDGAERTIKSVKDLKKAIVDLKKEAEKADYGTKAFDEITERLRMAQAQYREFRNDTKAKEIKDQFNDMAGGVSGSLGAAQSALSAFGVESKAMSSVVSGANAAISAALQFRNVQELKVEASTARRMVVEKAAAAGTLILNGVNKLLNTTLKANPIGILVTAVTALMVLLTPLISGLTKVVKWFTKLDWVTKALTVTMDALRNAASWLTLGLIDDAATKKTQDNADKIIKSFDDILSVSNKLKRQGEQQLALLQASGASEKEIHDQKIKNLAMESAAQEVLIRALEKKTEKSDEEIKKLAEAKVAKEGFWNAMIVENAAYITKIKQDNKKAADEQLAKDIEAGNKRQAKLDERNNKARDSIVTSLTAAQSLKDQIELQGIKDEDERARVALAQQQRNETTKLNDQISALEKLGSKRTKTETKLLEQLNSEKLLLEKKNIGDTNALIDEQSQKRLDKEKELQNKLKDLKDQLALASISDLRERALKELEMERDKQIKLAELEYNTPEQETKKQEAIETIRKLFRQKEVDLKAEWYTEDQQKELDKQAAEYENKDNSLQVRLEALQKMHDIEVAAATKRGEDVAEIEKKYAKMATDEKVEEILKWLEYAGQAVDQLAGISASYAQYEMNLEKQKLDDKKISEEEYDKNVLAIKRRAAKREKAFGITSAIINTAGAVVKAFLDPGGILGVIFAALAAATGIAQIAVISSTPLPTEGTEGGGGGEHAKPQPSKFAAGGLVNGPGSSVNDSVSAMLAPGESVMNANSTEMFGGLLSAMNQAGGGAPIGDATNQSTPIFKTYVVTSDMTSQLEAEKKIRDLARV